MLVTNGTQRGRSDLSQAYMEPETSTPASTPTEGENEPIPENLSGDPSSPTEVPPTVSSPPSLPSSRFSSTHSSRTATAYPLPLAVLNLYDLAYMGEKYGVWGKKQYAADWWRSLNWSEVDAKNSKRQ